MLLLIYRMPTEPANERPPRLFLHQQDNRTLIVYLPPTYEVQTERRFPVLYMQDGQNLFDPQTSFIKGNYWRMGETADALIEAGEVEPLIIAGIYNAGDRRIDEYTPGKDKRLGGGHADTYGRMLVDKLKPYIDARYRTLSGAAHCGLGGSSLGGLVSLYLGLRYPGVFSRLAVISPSVWWRQRAIIKEVAGLPQKPALRIWLDIGGKETQPAVSDTRALRDGLIRKGWQLGADLAYFEAENGEHTESAWAQRAGPMLRFLFPARS
jgi:predicted alpha/beta superfamily hydrolase